MSNKLRWAVAGAFLLLAIGVDFSSKLLSIGADALIIAVAGVILWPLVKSSK